MRRTFFTGKALLSDEPHVEKWTGDGSTKIRTLSVAVPSGLEDGVEVTRNGLQLERVASGPTTKDEYTLSGDQITFGLAPASNDRIKVRYWT